MASRIFLVIALGAVLELSLASKDLEWWKVGPVYQIYPASFADSNGDGIGDIRGIESHIDHFVKLGVAAVWLSPIYTSPMLDNGYDVANYTEVNPMFGNMTDIESLIDALHKRGINILLDMVPNHTSNQSQWFIDSIHRKNNKDDWYVWKDPKGKDSNGKPIPPNNWVSRFGGSAWEYNDVRNQFFLHQFEVAQPDLNYDNPEVMKGMESVVRFWLSKGVDGFRMDAVPFVGESNYDSDEPPIPGCTPAGSWECYNHIYTQNQNSTYDVTNHFAAVLNEDNKSFSAAPKVQFIEAYTDTESVNRYYQSKSTVPFNFLMISNVKRDTNAKSLEQQVQQYLKSLPANAWPNWVIGNHDNSRIGTRMGPELIDAMNMLLLLMPGTAISYNGEEIGMTDGVVKPSERRDPTADSRDPCRTPMQWNTSPNAGFSTNGTSLYLPVNPNFESINVETETKIQPSHLSIYEELVKLHKEIIGSPKDISSSVFNDWVFAFKREKYLVIINLNNLEETLTLEQLKLDLGKKVQVKIVSLGGSIRQNETEFSTHDTITLFPRTGLVFEAKSAASTIFASSMLVILSMCRALRLF
ncbi:alpha-glucosidase [Nesidiocoris tenuis]|uniref:alpha-glucosidase n=1 Tax=Nesidiocoris tenuis TaxID=355587 RepID=A0ABN7AWD7_9HEMI|nr:alpha-glucosidase [Nesidiocoris tenuis]